MTSTTSISHDLPPELAAAEAGTPRRARRRLGTDAVDAEGLVKRYGRHHALAGIDLAVPAGSVTALLGPNGAGKSTAVRILTTLTAPDAGRATVAGRDVVTQAQEVRRRIGLAAQDATVDPVLSGRENLVMTGELHQMPRRLARRRAAELLEQFSLSDAADQPVDRYSGGMRRRLDLAASLVADPLVLFLDEPTTGLDPRARRDLWDVLDGVVANGTTLLLTTQYLEEAERLADDIVVIEHGKVIAAGDAHALKQRVAGDQLRVVVADDADLAEVAGMVASVTGTTAAEVVVGRPGRTITAVNPHGVAAIAELAGLLSAAGVTAVDLSLHQPTLDDVFLTLTGATPDAVAPTVHGGTHP